MPSQRFQKGNKFAPGGKRPGSGRPSRERKKIDAQAEIIARKYLERHIGDVLKAAKLIATGVRRRRHNPKTGKAYYEKEYDGAQIRHWLDKFVPAAKQELQISGGLRIVKVDAFDPDGGGK